MSQGPPDNCSCIGRIQAIHGHNGYSNFETWCVSLWIWNEEGTYRYWVARATSGRLAAELEEWATEAMPELQGLYSDLMTYALGMVHWDEIAEGLAEMA